MKKVIFQLLFASVGFLGCSSSLALDKDLGNDNIEKPSDKENNDNENSILPLWQEGELLIHAINTGRGECMFYLKSASNLNGNLNCSKELEHYAS